MSAAEVIKNTSLGPCNGPFKYFSIIEKLAEAVFFFTLFFTLGNILVTFCATSAIPKHRTGQNFKGNSVDLVCWT